MNQLAKEEDTPDFKDIPTTEIEREVDSLAIEQEAPTEYISEEDEPISPEPVGTVLTKYRVEPSIPKSQEKNFDPFKGSFGRHVALSNTKRMDNLRHLDAIDLVSIYDRIPTMRHRATMIRIRETSEFQMCRGNPEIGGFEAKIGVTNIKREDVDLKQTQTMGNTAKRKKGMLGFLRRNKE